MHFPQHRCKALVLAALAAVASGAGLAQDGFTQGLKPGDRVTVDISGFKFQATVTGRVPCPRDPGQCVTVTNDNGGKLTYHPMYLKPPQAGAAAAAQAARTTRPTGEHACSAFAGGRLMTLRGFTLKDNGSFTDHGGGGRWSWDASTGTVTMSGGAWNGQKLRTRADGSLNVLRADGSRGATDCSRA